MKRAPAAAALAAWLVLAGAGCQNGARSMESISLDYPYGETRLLVQRSGESFLSYGALPQRQTIKNGTFDIDELYGQLRERLHENIPREKWPNPKSKAGMVKIRFKDKGEKDYLIFDEEAFTERLFAKARNNVVIQAP